MNFEEYWSSQDEPKKSNVDARNAAMLAWDAALCAVQAKNYDEKGKLRTNHSIAATISDLHSWYAALTR